MQCWSLAFFASVVLALRGDIRGCCNDIIHINSTYGLVVIERPHMIKVKTCPFKISG